MRALRCLLLSGVVALGVMPAAAHAAKHHDGLSIQKDSFGSLPNNGRAIDRYTLSNARGVSISIITYGGIVQRVDVPDRHGRTANVTLGFKDLAGYTSDAYVKSNPYFGALIGRYGNRIGGAKFTLDGVTYNLDPNNGPNSLHGGYKGFDKYVWDAKTVSGFDTVGLQLSRTSAEGEGCTKPPP